MMIMKYIEDIDVFNKNVILRLDLNVTIKEGKILDDTKIKKSIPTIEYLLTHDANILIMSHLGKIKNEEDKGKVWGNLQCSLVRGSPYGSPYGSIEGENWG